jgi:hypothetical protein
MKACSICFEHIYLSIVNKIINVVKIIHIQAPEDVECLIPLQKSIFFIALKVISSKLYVMLDPSDGEWASYSESDLLEINYFCLWKLHKYKNHNPNRVTVSFFSFFSLPPMGFVCRVYRLHGSAGELLGRESELVVESLSGIINFLPAM